MSSLHVSPRRSATGAATAIASAARIIRAAALQSAIWHAAFGYDHKYVYSHIGYNLKATDIQAAIGCAQLKKLDRFIAARRRNWTKLHAALAPYADRLILPETPADSEPSYFGFVITVPRQARASRAATSRPSWKPPRSRPAVCSAAISRRHPAYRDIPCRIVGDLANTDAVMNGTFFIGVYPGLGDEQLDYMVRPVWGVPARE